VKAYLITTGSLFGLLAAAHLWLTITEWSRVATDASFAVQAPGIGVLAATLSIWAWRLLWTSTRP
jgi:hypothetical protein